MASVVAHRTAALRKRPKNAREGERAPRQPATLKGALARSLFRAPREHKIEGYAPRDAGYGLARRRFREAAGGCVRILRMIRSYLLLCGPSLCLSYWRQPIEEVNRDRVVAKSLLVQNWNPCEAQIDDPLGLKAAADAQVQAWSMVHDALTASERTASCSLQTVKLAQSRGHSPDCDRGSDGEKRVFIVEARQSPRIRRRIGPGSSTSPSIRISTATMSRIVAERVPAPLFRNGSSPGELLGLPFATGPPSSDDRRATHRLDATIHRPSRRSNDFGQPPWKCHWPTEGGHCRAHRLDGLDRECLSRECEYDLERPSEFYLARCHLPKGIGEHQ